MALLKRIASWILRKELQTKDNTIDKLYTVINEKVDKPVVEVIRLRRDVFSTLKRSLQQQVITNQTTDLQAAALVGQQRVLDLLEDGFVNER